jgi:hypothetical protein
VEAVPQLQGDVYQCSVHVGPYKTLGECEQDLPEAIERSARQYVEEYLDLGPAVKRIRLPADELRRQLVKAEWEETIESPTVGPMKQLHVLIEFGPEFRERVRQEWKRLVITDRLWRTGSAGVVGLALLGVLFGYLKIDQATGGARRGRLRVAAAAAVLAVVLAGLLVAQAGWPG